LVIRDKAIESVTIGGNPLDEKATYRVVTVDYLAEGNDNMEALTQATGYTDSHIMIRDAMTTYIKKLTSENKLIDANADERLYIKE
jgi:2',3'-cyclic-nucleotide 2'-phosphodiesterase (5'-nucleotidase family)